MSVLQPNILLGNPQPQPLIYLRGVQFSTLENIIKFIYQGEVIVSLEQVNTFLNVAQDLQVKGLGVPTRGVGDEVSTNTMVWVYAHPHPSIFIVIRGDLPLT